MTRRRKFIFRVTILLVVSGLVAGVSLGLVLSVTRNMPQIEALEEFKPIAATRVFSVDNRLIAQFFIRKRLPISLNDVPEHLKQAVISIEDRRFYKHAGLDVIRNFGALANDLRTRSLSQGASTITQQLARTLFLSLEKKFSRKFAEMFLALQIERRYTKDEILELYLNQIPFGPGIYGVGAAAEIYLGKKVSELTVVESALLAGLPRWPAGYSPFNHPERAIKRRNAVLKTMLRDGHLSPEEYDEAVNKPLETAEHGDGQYLAPYFSEYIRQELVERFGHNMVYQGGLRVQTTLDYRLQELAEKALTHGVVSLAERLGSVENAPENESLQGALVVLEPGTGRILAMVGGKNYYESKFNRATQALRQPGSAFKPIVYAAAIENGSTQAEGIWDAPISFDIPGRDEPWKPENFSKKFEGAITLRKALEISQNIPAIKLMNKVGQDKVISLARRMGLKTPLGRNLSLALGTSEAILLELTSTYNCLASSGVSIEPLGLAQVTDQTGRVIYQARPKRTAALSAETAYILTDMLKGVITDGTGRRAQVLNRPLAGKTGTTDNSRDALFIGYSPEITAGVWVGYDSTVLLGRDETGARAALPIWVDFMGEALKDRPVRDFDKPANVVMIPMDRITGRRATASTFDSVEAAFKVGTGPKK